MNYQQTTQIPNMLFDQYLPDLTEGELKILLIIIRQTNGWIDKFTGKRKIRDRITQSQFRIKTGLSSRIISKTLKSLSDKDLIAISDQNNQLLKNSLDRKGKAILYYEIAPAHFTTSTNAQSDIRPVHKSAYNKTKYSKINKTKLRESPFRINTVKHIRDVLELAGYQV